MFARCAWEVFRSHGGARMTHGRPRPTQRPGDSLQRRQICSSRPLVCLPAPARDFQPDPPVYNLSNRIRFGRQMSAERALCGMRIDQRGAVARKSPARAGWLRIARGRGVASTPSCHQDGARRRPSAELAVGSRPPGAPSTTRIVKGIGGLTIDVDGASLSIRDPTWRNSTLPTSFSAVSF